MRFDDCRTEWRISDVERKADAANRRLHEVDSLRSDVDRLEHTNRAFSSTCDELRHEIEALQESFRRLELLLPID